MGDHYGSSYSGGYDRDRKGDFGGGGGYGGGTCARPSQLARDGRKILASDLCDVEARVQATGLGLSDRHEAVY